MSFEDDFIAATETIVGTLGGTLTHNPVDGQSREIAATFHRESIEPDDGIGELGIESERTTIAVPIAVGEGIAIGDEIVRSDASYIVIGPAFYDEGGLVTFPLELNEVPT